MIIYKCIITGDEMFADTFKIKETEDGILYEVEGKCISRTETFDESKIGANASAEEATEASDDTCTETGVDIVLNHKLVETSFDKKSYVIYIKEYMKAVKAKLEETNPERVPAFMAGANKAVAKILTNIKNYQFFMGESMNPECTLGLMDFREDGTTPFMVFFKDGLVSEKC